MIQSPFSALFLAIQARIRAEVPDIRWVDADLGQLESYGDRPPVAFPCCLISFDGFSYTDGGDASQTAQGEVSLRLCTAPYSASHSAAPAEVKETAMKHYELEWALHKALHDWQAAYAGNAYEFGSLTRTGSGNEQREDPLRVRVIRYAIAFEDYSTQRGVTFAPAAPAFTVEITA